MNCRDTSFVHAYADRELDLTQSLEMEQHLQDCGRCTLELQNQQILKTALGNAQLYYSAPEELRRQVAATSRRSLPGSGRFHWNLNWLFAISASAVAAVVLLFGLAGRQSAQEQLVAELTSSHVRSLMADHLADVISTDQHTVKPWFNGKIDFAPPIKDLAEDGFPLVGGRLDYIRGRAAAALVYSRRRHTINLFIWPEGAAENPAVLLKSRGYNLAHWSTAGMQFWAVSDLNGPELKEFAETFAH